MVAVVVQVKDLGAMHELHVGLPRLEDVTDLHVVRHARAVVVVVGAGGQVLADTQS